MAENNSIKIIDNKMKEIDKQIDILEDKEKQIQDSRDNKKLNKAIYRCTDEEALKLQNIDKKIKALENKQDNLLTEKRKIQLAIHKKECKIAHEKFKNAKYEIRYLYYSKNNKIKVIKVIYTNNYKQYITKNINDLYSLNANSIVINEYINCNNVIDRTVNMPKKVTIYNFGHVDVTLLKPSNNIIYTCIPNQNGGLSYLEKWTDLNDKILQLIETGYTNSHKEIYTRGINIWGNEFIMIHDNFSSPNFLSIEKERGKKIEIDYLNSRVTYKKMKRNDKSKLDMCVQELIEKTIDKLSKNKDYKYDINYIKDFMYD